MSETTATVTMGWDGVQSPFEVRAELNNPNSSYDFDDVIVVENTDDGTLWCAADSGCSCPMPFEGAEFVPATWGKVNELVAEWCAYGGRSDAQEAARMKFLSDVSTLLRRTPLFPGDPITAGDEK